MTMSWPLAVAVLVVPFSICAAGQEEESSQADNKFFSRSIEPLLKRHCLGCHSHSTGEMEGGLTLDTPSGWRVGGSRGPAIVPGKAEKSLLIKAVRRHDAKLRMPPDNKLADAEVALLVEWVKRGAVDPRRPKGAARPRLDSTDWWSLRPLGRPSVPQPGQKTDRDMNPIDAFILRKLQAKGLSPSPPADRGTLIRRLYVDLIGLPPEPQVVAAFVADRDPRAYPKLIDRLLSSPRYGERWARHWLDTVHFADSHGCEHDVLRPNAWRYRDYVIASFNRDTSWPRFIREQLAADWFYRNETHLSAALGFIAAGPLELSRAGTAPVTFDYLDRDDIVTQTMASFASTTANCARCHRHKFDPITQEDYYSLQAVFSGAGKGDLEYDADPTIGSERRRWTDLLQAARNGDRRMLLAPQYTKLVAQWEKRLGNKPAVWQPLSPQQFSASHGTTLKRLDDNSLLASGVRPDKDTYSITTSPTLSKLTAIRLEVMADARLPMKGPGRQDNGNLHLTEFEALEYHSSVPEYRQLKILKATADWNQAGWTIAHSIDGNPATAWGIYPKVGQTHSAVFELAEPISLKPDSRIEINLKQLHGSGHLIGRLKLYATDAASGSAMVLPSLVRSTLKLPPAQRSEADHAALAAHVLSLHAERSLAALPKPAAVYAWSKRYSHGKQIGSPMKPRVVHVLRRGDIHQPGKVVGPGALSAIDALPSRFKLKDPSNEATRRAALADWLAAPENPLTWRSIVNRVWSYHFGRGLCDTPNDFGRMGGVPSHPELLDWLAVWFRDDAKGSIKKLHRLILTSSTWRQRSRVASPGATAIDAENQLLWRMNARRLDAESTRDAILKVSGHIDLQMKGPGVQQFKQSKGQQLTPKLDYGAFDWNHPAAGRRSIYRVVWRGMADPFMESLDFPDLGLLSPKRDSSVSALQSLTVFNNDFVLHHSQILADKLARDHESLQDQLGQACRLIYLREPRREEIALLVAYARKHGLAAACRVLFNSNEFNFVD